MMPIASISNVGAITSPAKISVTATAQQVTITAGKNNVQYQNQGSNRVWFGGSDVDPANNVGIYANPGFFMTYENVDPDNFEVYVVCASGETSTLGRNES